MPSTTLATMVLLAALQGAPPPPPPAPPESRTAAPAAAPQRSEHPEEPQFDPAAVERGQDLLVAQCGFCHGSQRARRAAGARPHALGPSCRSDENGKQLGAFLKVGRPELKMPKVRPARDGRVRSGDVPARDDPRRCRTAATTRSSTSWSATPRPARRSSTAPAAAAPATRPTGDLKGIGAKYDAADPAGTAGDAARRPAAADRRGQARGCLPTWTRPRSRPR